MEKYQIKHNCFTIGHSNHSIENFLRLLEKYKINLLIDVRSFPYSKFVSQFNKENLKYFLKEKKINYLYLGNKLGGKYKDINLLFPDGTPNYKKVMQSLKYNTGLKKVIDLINKGNNVALMCLEKNPIDCHRFNLISRSLEIRGVKVLHIMENGNLKTNNEVKDELVKEFMNNYYNLSLFNEPLSKEEALEKAYELSNKKIANPEK